MPLTTADDFETSRLPADPRRRRADAVLRGLAVVRPQMGSMWLGLMQRLCAMRLSTARTMRAHVAPRHETAASPEVLQLERLSDDIKSAVARVEHAVHCHAGAARRIDAALCELDRLKEELTGVLRTGGAASTSASPFAADSAVMAAPAAAVRSAA